VAVPEYGVSAAAARVVDVVAAAAIARAKRIGEHTFLRIAFLFTRRYAQTIACTATRTVDEAPAGGEKGAIDETMVLLRRQRIFDA
jgi:hypothetical protein